MRRIWAFIHRHHAGVPKLHEREAELLLSALLLIRGHLPRKWLIYAVEVTATSRRANPAGYLFTCLANNLAELLDLCTVSEARGHFGRLITAVRPKVEPLVAEFVAAEKARAASARSTQHPEPQPDPEAAAAAEAELRKANPRLARLLNSICTGGAS
jgi:hypothetical protein